MSHRPVEIGALETLNGRLSDTARATLIRVARKIADGYEGVVEITVGKGGGIRFVRWSQTETGDSIREDVG